MSRALVETNWFDLSGWKARLLELRADPPADRRTGLIAEIEDHIAWLERFPGTPENSPQSAPSAP